MHYTGQPGPDWSKVVILVICAALLVAMIVWLKLSFGDGYALAGLLAVAVVASLIAGVQINQNNTAHVLARVAQFMDNVTDGEIARQRASAGLLAVERERARAEAAAQISAIRLAEQQSRQQMQIAAQAARGQLQIETRAAGAVAAMDARLQRQQEQQQAAVYRPSWQQAAPDHPDFPEV